MMEIELVETSGISMGGAKDALRPKVRAVLLKEFIVLVERFHSLLLWPLGAKQKFTAAVAGNIGNQK